MVTRLIPRQLRAESVKQLWGGRPINAHARGVKQLATGHGWLEYGCPYFSFNRVDVWILGGSQAVNHARRYYYASFGYASEENGETPNTGTHAYCTRAGVPRE